MTPDWPWVFAGMGLGFGLSAVVVMVNDWLLCRTVDRETDQ